MADSEYKRTLTSLGPEEKLIAIKMRLEDRIRNRLQALRDECLAIGTDMEAFLGRIDRDGHFAQIDDFKAARWRRAADQLKALREEHAYACSMLNMSCKTIRLPRAAIDSEQEDETNGE